MGEGGGRNPEPGKKRKKMTIVRIPHRAPNLLKVLWVVEMAVMMSSCVLSSTEARQDLIDTFPNSPGIKTT